MMDSQAVKAQAQELGFHVVGIASVANSNLAQAQQRLQTWLNQGYQADMHWMANPKRQDITQILPNAQSVIAVGLNYYTPHQRPNTSGIGKISRYAWGRDYHRVLTKRLKALSLWLGKEVPGSQQRFYVDTGPVQDKAWAEQAGLGWVGKHGNVINRKYGSWLFLGEVITDIPLTPDAPHTAHCGTCTRCLETCPTQAIVEPFVVNSQQCIAYHTIENRAPQLPPAIANQLQGWVAGCDICQDVCPWNQRFAQPTDVADFEPYPQNIAPKLTDLAAMETQDWQERFPASALRRIKPAMFRRNAQTNLQ